MQTLISVVVPVYNREKHLCECVDRVLAQTFTDFELVLVDDGSTDRSAEICDAYAKKDTRVKVIHKQNGGVSSARNEGIAASSGEYITFIDSDDSVDADFLEYAYKRMSDGGFDLFVTGIVMEYWENGEITDKVEYRINGDRVFDRRGLLEAWEKEYPIILTSGPWCKLYKASIIKENDIQFDTSLSCGEDTYFNLDVIRKINSVCISERVFYHYRRDDKDSLFSRFHRSAYEIYFKVLGKMRDTLEMCECSDSTMRNFECYYVKAMITAIQEFYMFYDESTREEKKQLIKKVAANRYVRALPIRDIGSRRNMIVLALLKLRFYGILMLAYEIKRKKK